MTDRKEIQLNDGCIELPYNLNGRRNAIPTKLELCADSRKDNCPYYVRVRIETDFISFHQGICTYTFKKEKN